MSNVEITQCSVKSWGTSSGEHRGPASRVAGGAWRQRRRNQSLPGRKTARPGKPTGTTVPQKHEGGRALSHTSTSTIRGLVFQSSE